MNRVWEPRRRLLLIAWLKETTSPLYNFVLPKRILKIIWELSRDSSEVNLKLGRGIFLCTGCETIFSSDLCDELCEVCEDCFLDFCEDCVKSSGGHYSKWGWTCNACVEHIGGCPALKPIDCEKCLIWEHNMHPCGENCEKCDKRDGIFFLKNFTQNIKLHWSVICCFQCNLVESYTFFDQRLECENRECFEYENRECFECDKIFCFDCKKFGGLDSLGFGKWVCQTCFQNIHNIDCKTINNKHPYDLNCKRCRMLNYEFCPEDFLESNYHNFDCKTINNKHPYDLNCKRCRTLNYEFYPEDFLESN